MSLGLKIAASYGIYPCQLGLCGPRNRKKTVSKFLFDYLLGKKVPEGQIRKILEQFKGAFSYYRLIAKSNGFGDPFDEQVVKAYWIGNELLENVSIDSLKEMIIEEFSGPGLLLKRIAQEKSEQVSDSSRAHHSFHVLVIGSVTGTIKLEGKLLDICRISWGEITKIVKDKVVIKYQPLKDRRLGRPIEKSINWNRDLTPEVKIGDWVSVHWNQLIQVLDKDALFNLEKYTQLTLSSLTK